MVFFSTRDILGDKVFTTCAVAKPLRRRIALLFVCENLTVVGRIHLPNCQAYPLPMLWPARA